MNAIAIDGRTVRRAVQLACATLALAFGMPHLAASAEPAHEPSVMIVGTDHWSAQRLAWSMLAADAPLSMDAGQLDTFAQAFSQRHILAKEAQTAGLASDPRIAERLALARDTILADEQVARLRQLAPVDARQVRARYDADPTSHDEYRLSQILVRISDNDPAVPPAQRRTAAQALARARSIQRQLEHGAHFATLARRVSDDVDSRDHGGQLPEMFAMDLRADLRSAVAVLRPQSVSEPLLSSDGYHLIRLDEKTSPNFESSRRLLEFELRDAWANAEVSRLRSGAPVMFDATAWLAQRDRLLAQEGAHTVVPQGTVVQGSSAVGLR
ncbi:peptidylprolyl isomerase [Variovorax sp. E3]|uniref:peptidylprolyl isomerase n=1 Tax=Variovorax sp. E3 TaxID=1914993 RepID=UPI0018DC5CEC|nr:peptidylprolyl isomerase [Variovorax sp. E3]